MAAKAKVSGYNGWSNRATWNVSLWLNNDEAMYRNLQDTVKFARAHFGPTMTAAELGRMLKIEVNKMWPSGQTPDGCNLLEVDWIEFAKSEMDAG